MTIQKEKYRFKPYSNEYPKLYRLEESKLRKILPKDSKIEHVGSTSIPGLGGKGIIDIAISLKGRDIEKSLKILEKAGFEYKPKQIGDKERKFLQKIIKRKGKERRVHLHLVQHNHEFWTSFITFRNYLRQNKRARDEYTKIKKEAAKHAKGDGKKYGAYKGELLTKLVKIAMKEHKTK